MSTKDDFSLEEWTALLQGPMIAGMSVISADPAITSVPKETAAMAKAMLVNPVPAGGEELIASMVADIQSMSDNKEKMTAPEFAAKDATGITAEINQKMTDLAAMVDGKLSAAEATAYKEWVMSVAQTVAEAGKEGGFLGIGAVRVSPEEEAALAALRSDLGLA